MAKNDPRTEINTLEGLETLVDEYLHETAEAMNFLRNICEKAIFIRTAFTNIKTRELKEQLRAKGKEV